MNAAHQIEPRFPAKRVCVESYIHPGEVYVTDRPSRLTTILGSCVSVCLFDADFQVAGLNHFLLPHTPATSETSTRYGDVAMDVLVGRLLALGATRQRLVAKLFGGANVLHAFADDARHIGAANVELARALLARQNIPIGAEDVGGTRGRKLVFCAPDGAAWVKVLGP
jgi:chemotaxis protein CheD